MKLAVLVFGVIHIVLSESFTLDDYKKDPCHRLDPNLNKCALKNLRELIPFFLEGVTDYGIPVLNPLVLPSLVVSRKIDEGRQIRMELTNFIVTGGNSIRVNYIKVEPEDTSVNASITIPACQLTTEYDIDTTLFNTRLVGKLEGNFSDIKAFITFNLKKVEKEEFQHYALGRFEIFATVGDGHIKLTTKKPEDQKAGDLFANMYNSNPRMLDNLAPAYNNIIVDELKPYIENVLATLNVDEFLPD